MRLDNLVEFVLEKKQADEAYNPGDNRRHHPAKPDAAEHAPEGPAPTLDNGDTGQGKINFFSAVGSNEQPPETSQQRANSSDELDDNVVQGVSGAGQAVGGVG